MSQTTPYLSVVAASRNDDHGGDPLRRTQIFVNCFARQCEKYRLPAELILVDWNPVDGRPGLAAALRLPEGSSYCQARVITVPANLHRRIKYGDRLSFFQMIAKNAGIRRARGQFVLATNIDIIFSDELMAFLSRQQLDPTKQYRVDRYDIQAGLSEHLTLEETLAYAWTNPVRQHKRLGPAELVAHLYGGQANLRHCRPSPEVARTFNGIEVREAHGAWQVEMERTAAMAHLHTNACGDFTLLSREGWAAIRGYPEFEAFSFNIDSMGLVAAHYEGYTEVSLLPPCVCFHIEHSLGSGWTPEGERKLFNRLRQANILNPEWPVLMPLVDQMRSERRTLEFNHAGWGLADFELPDQRLGDRVPLPATPVNSVARDVAAINPAYDLDSLTLIHERGASRNGFSNREDYDTQDIVQLFVPLADGSFSEQSSLKLARNLADQRAILFRFKAPLQAGPLRLDPVARAGLIEIPSLTLIEVTSGRILMHLTGADAKKITIGGSAKRVAPSDADRSRGENLALYALSTGDDPQIILPPVPDAPADGEFLLRFDLRFFPSAD